MKELSEARRAAIASFKNESLEETKRIGDLEREDFLCGEYGPEISYRAWFKTNYANYDFVQQHEMYTKDIVHLFNEVCPVPYDEIPDDEYDICTPPRPILRNSYGWEEVGPMQVAEEDITYVTEWSSQPQNWSEEKRAQCEFCFSWLLLNVDGRLRKHDCLPDGR